MAHWFHRNPIKATDKVTFDLKSVATTEQCIQICNDLRVRRKNLLELFTSAHNDLEIVTNEFNQYLSLFMGFIYEVPRNTEKKLAASKLLPLIRFTWANSMLGETVCEVSNSWFEVLNMLVNMALWLMKHAASISARDEVSETESKRIYSCLRRAAGMFIFVRSNIDKIERKQLLKGCDLDSSVLSAYITQCIAEAQEISVARAIELKHSSSLISSLTHNTSALFIEADKYLHEQDQSIFSKWRFYLLLKAQIYLSYAYAFFGKDLLSNGKCGKAIRACKEGVSNFNLAEEYVQKYSGSSGPGMKAKPENHLFYRRIKPLLIRYLEQAERENGFIYHQTVADECPALDKTAEFGLARPEEFRLPPFNNVWSYSVYTSFNLSKATMPDFSKIKLSKKSLPPPKEEKLYETDLDPRNLSGCAVM